MVVVEAIETIADQGISDLPMLYEAVGSEALDAVVQSRGPHGQWTDCEVTFTYHGYEVAVWSYGAIENQRADKPQ